MEALRKYPSSPFCRGCLSPFQHSSASSSTFLITYNHITFLPSKHSGKEKVYSASLSLDLNYWSLSLTFADSCYVSWTWFWSHYDTWLFPNFILWFEIPISMLKLNLPKQDWSKARQKICLILCGDLFLFNEENDWYVCFAMCKNNRK